MISGHDEAVLDFEGAAHAQKLKDGVMVDIGGGSTEVVAFADGKITDAVSLEFGSLSMYKTYVSRLFPKNSEERAIRKKVENEIKKVKFLKRRSSSLICGGIGGTIRAVKKFNNDRFGLPKGERSYPYGSDASFAGGSAGRGEADVKQDPARCSGSCAHHGAGDDHFRHALRLFQLRRDPHEQFRCKRRLFI